VIRKITQQLLLPVFYGRSFFVCLFYIVEIWTENKINQQNGGQTNLIAARNVRRIKREKELNEKNRMITLHFTTNMVPLSGEVESI
jgi:hypothetical protein